MQKVMLSAACVFFIQSTQCFSTVWIETLHDTTFCFLLYFQQYYHGESIAVNVQITNNSNKTVKKIKISVRQLADICLFSSAQYKCPVAVLET